MRTTTHASLRNNSSGTFSIGNSHWPFLVHMKVGFSHLGLHTGWCVQTGTYARVLKAASPLPLFWDLRHQYSQASSGTATPLCVGTSRWFASSALAHVAHIPRETVRAIVSVSIRPRSSGSLSLASVSFPFPVASVRLLRPPFRTAASHMSGPRGSSRESVSAMARLFRLSDRPNLRTRSCQSRRRSTRCTDGNDHGPFSLPLSLPDLSLGIVTLPLNSWEVNPKGEVQGGPKDRGVSSRTAGSTGRGWRWKQETRRGAECGIERTRMDPR